MRLERTLFQEEADRLQELGMLAEAQRRYDGGERMARWSWREDTVISRRERKVRALMAGIGFAMVEGLPEVNPWQALLNEIARCHHRIHWYERQIAQATVKPEDVLPGGAAHPWVMAQIGERKRLAETTKIAIAAGLAERMIRQVELEADAMAVAALRVMDFLGVEGRQRDEALDLMGRTLMEIENETRALPS